MRYYIYAEDLVGVVIGPFDTIEAAEAHIKFCQERGDAATTAIITESKYQEEYVDDYDLMSPEEDRSFEEAE